MLRHMRTTIRMKAGLADKAKKYCQKQGMSFTHFVEEAVTAYLHTPVNLPAQKAISLPSFKGKGLMPGVDLDDSAALLDLMEK